MFAEKEARDQNINLTYGGSGHMEFDIYLGANTISLNEVWHLTNSCNSQHGSLKWVPKLQDSA